MTWDSKKRRYVDEHGRVMSEAQVRREIDEYISQEQAKVEREAGKLLAGAVTLAAFFLFMRHRVEAWHKVTGAIAYGGRAQVDSERAARIAAKIESEMQFLNKFREEAAGMVAEARALAASSELTTTQALAETAASIPARASMYANAAYSTYVNNVTAREFDEGVMLGRRVCPEDDASCEECVDAAGTEWRPLDEIEEIGSLQCINNCRCFIEYAEPMRAQLILDSGSVQQSEAVQ